MHPGFTWPSVMAALVCASSASAVVELYGSHAHFPIGPSQWGLLQFKQPLDGATQRVGTGGLMLELDFSPDGLLYSTDGEELHVVDTITGAQEQIGDFFTGPGIMSGIACSPDGVIYGFNNGGAGTRLFTVDAATGAATEVGAVGASIWSMDFNASGDLYASRANEIVRIDPATGAIVETVLSGVGGYEGLDIGPDGVMRGVRLNTATIMDELHEIDLLTGDVHVVGVTTERSMEGLASIPTPGTAAMLALACACASGRRRR